MKLLIFFLLISLVFPAQISAQTAGFTWTGACVSNGAATIQGFECLVSRILNIGISLLGLFILIMLIIGSYQLITSGGDPQKVAGGKGTITAAITGLIIAISGWFIINFIGNFTGATGVTRFNTQVENIQQPTP